ncbi:uncharacterized protein EV420DRAFT_1668224 [Desarmillaria tabescens]|uniref:PH domain-containing protein n=1 Tax=Armillaria tabescens TaxID=1929756 RepID=A0AA39N8L4_ARMTA|nr:uncharacterized protein EV420DRAFT_1668224 [Desarmillaria tabescens]KAK0461050.1 hypothetical protein EV420DRAFT_1668224 [Desarmillaria tabescens]
MNGHKASPLRDKLLSNSPDPVKSSILRDSGMGWSPSDATSGTGTKTSPLRFSKRDIPARPPMPDLARRSSSSYRHLRNNNLVSKSPFKSQIPTPSTPSRNAPPNLSSSPRRVSGEKRPRPTSMHDQSETENERPFALKRERRQSKTFQGLINKEPVKKSPFLHTSSPEEPAGPECQSEPVVLQPPPIYPASPSRIPVPLPSAASPARSSLVSRRLHGPRLSGRRERRKTVTFDERCDVVEFDCEEEDISDDALESDYSDHEGFEEDYDGVGDADPFFHGPNSSGEADDQPDDPYESIEISDSGQKLELDPDTSITGLVDAMFGSRQTSTPPRHGADIPTDLDTEDGVPFGRSHHVERAARHHLEATPPRAIPFNSLPPVRSASASPATPSQRTPATPPIHDSFTRSDGGNEDIQMLPESPSPTKHRSSPRASLLKLSGSPAQPGMSGPDPFALPSLNDASLPDDSQEDPANLSLPLSDVNISTMAAALKTHNTPLPEEYKSALNDSVRSSPSAFSPSPTRRSPLPPIPTSAGMPASCASSPTVHPASNAETLPGSSHLRPRISREDIQKRLSRQLNTGSPSPANSPRACDRPRSLDSPRHSFTDSPRITTADISGATESPQPADNSLRGDSPQPVDVYEAVDVAHPPSSDTADPANSPHGSLNSSRSPTDDRRQDEEKDRDTTSIMTAMTDASAIGIEEPSVAHEEFGMLKPAENGQRLKFDFGSKFGLGGLGIDDMDLDETDSPFSSKSELTPTRSDLPTKSTARTQVASVDVDMDMRSALDRLLDDVAGHQVEQADLTMTEDGDASCASEEKTDTEASPVKPRLMERAATDSALVVNGPGSGVISRSVSGSSACSDPPPPLPPKDNIRSREAMILEKRREMRRLEEEEEEEFLSRTARRDEHLTVTTGRPSRRRSRSTGDVEGIRGNTRRGADGKLLDVVSPTIDDPLADSIEKELKKLEGPSKSKYHVRQHEGTIYASSDTDRVSHMAGPGDVNAGKAWRPVRRPSDMNEYAKQIKEYRAQEKPGKAYGKVFVKVLGLRGIRVPMPKEPTAVSCTLNNGIHFVTTPECKFTTDSSINQEFELIEHSKLEFTLTLKIRRDPHIIAQFNAVVPPPPPQAVVSPPVITHTSSKTGMRSFFSSTPKKPKEKQKHPAPAAVQAPVAPMPLRLTENLARYLKPDGTLARAFIAFKDVAHRCDTRLFETAFPLIGQRLEPGNKVSTLQVGEIVLQIFRLPPLPGITPDQLPQSLEECHRGLRHINWHKVTYFEGTLTQSGGDCSSWRRRQLRVIGSNLVAFNNVTKRVTATIDLKKATAVEDDQPKEKALSPGARSRYADEYDGMYGVERSFRLIFPEDEIAFFADTDEEKARWLDVLRALVGHIPPHPLWAELLWQRQEELSKKAKSGSAPSTRPSSSKTST